MEPFEYDGVFWTVDEPARQVGGRLSYNPAEGSSLSLTGAFVLDPMAAFQLTAQPIRINGMAGRKFLTLEGCLLTNTNISSSGLATAQYYVPYVLVGKHFGKDDEISFDDLMVRFDQLTYWVDRRPFSFSLESSDPHKLTDVASSGISYKMPDLETAPMSGGEARLGSMQSITGDGITEMRIVHQAQLGLHYIEPHDLATLIIDINSLQDIITLAADTPTVPDEVVFRRVDITRDNGQGNQVQIPIEMYHANAVERVRLEHPQRTNGILLPYEKVGGTATVGKWIGVSRQYRVILGYLLSLKYSTRLYEENRFTNAISAAETYHRISGQFPNEIRPKAEYKSYRRKLVRAIKKMVGTRASNWVGDQLLYSNEPRLRDRLTDLADHAGPSFAFIVGDIPTWASVVTTARNRLTHQDESQPFKREAGDLTILAESLYILMLICLFKECEVPEDAFADIPNVSRIRSLTAQIQSILPRLNKFSTRKSKSAQATEDAESTTETAEGRNPDTAEVQ